MHNLYLPTPTRKHGKPKKDNKDRMSSLSLGEDITLLGVPGDTLKHHKETHTPEVRSQAGIQRGKLIHAAMWAACPMSNSIGNHHINIA